MVHIYTVELPLQTREIGALNLFLLSITSKLITFPATTVTAVTMDTAATIAPKQTLLLWQYLRKYGIQQPFSESCDATEEFPFYDEISVYAQHV